MNRPRRNTALPNNMTYRDLNYPDRYRRKQVGSIPKKELGKIKKNELIKEVKLFFT